MNLPLIRIRKRIRRRARERQDKREDESPILKRLRAALLRSFRGLHGEKMVCVGGVSGVTGTLGKANSHFDPTQTGSGTAPPRRGGCCSSILLALYTVHATKLLYIVLSQS